MKPSKAFRIKSVIALAIKGQTLPFYDEAYTFQQHLPFGRYAFEPKSFIDGSTNTFSSNQSYRNK